MRRRHNTGDSRRYYDWMDRAEEDMETVELLRREDRCYFSCAFHCQQAIEKALKAYILVKTGNLVDGHNLSWLCKQAVKHDGEFAQWLDESAALNHCYIETRYPTDVPYEMGRGQVRRFADMAREMFTFICEQVEEELDAGEPSSAGPEAAGE
ncbi:HEPN domain-containing protein [Bittarella massiliensis (ex Durand et al. 2017)]|uniref:HEPN domain-containing protein n=1 Tax=Bittarella massiliensis (ex Durand et al. 2017) TaxID=1720313 RepID=UPI001AA15E49|nr:HEPN domain-containing protein [Bittarella massiliensis (ex Durand et al. 2017)]MBO1678367.1 HEPN domain-containing protein [Bittarella massiliensis (ex Durand et al. 2017)]